jgi:hypothetical protein
MHFIKRLQGSLKKWLSRDTHRTSSLHYCADPGTTGHACLLSVTCQASDSPRLERELVAATGERQLSICHLHKMPLPDRTLLQLVAYIEGATDARAQLVKVAHCLAVDRAVRAVRWERLPPGASQADHYPAHIEIRTHRAHVKRLTAFAKAARTSPAASRYPRPM